MFSCLDLRQLLDLFDLHLSGAFRRTFFESGQLWNHPEHSGIHLLSQLGVTWIWRLNVLTLYYSPTTKIGDLHIIKQYYRYFLLMWRILHFLFSPSMFSESFVDQILFNYLLIPLQKFFFNLLKVRHLSLPISLVLVWVTVPLLS